MDMMGRMLIATAIIVVPAAAFALEEHVGRNAERGDPQRWYEPADTPQKVAETMKKEAGAALAEAIQECRAQRSSRKECEAQAREQYRRDLEYARAVVASVSVR